jgi:RNA polymerase sigma-70 factor (ECF subfamily)
MADNDSHLGTHPSLLLRLRDLHDAGAWQLFVTIYGPLIFRYCRRQGLQEADTADVAQEVLGQVSRSIATFEYQPERGRFRDWLGTVVHGKLVRHHENRARRGRERSETGELALAEHPASSGKIDPAWADEFNAHLLQIALDRIRHEFEDTNWRAFEMVWLHDRSGAEVSEALGMTPSAIYVTKWRVLKRLREEILMLADDVPHLVPLAEEAGGPKP